MLPVCLIERHRVKHTYFKLTLLDMYVEPLGSMYVEHILLISYTPQTHGYVYSATGR